MIGRETRVLLRHYLEQSMSKAVIARQVGINPRTVYRWIAAGQLDRELDDGGSQVRTEAFAALEASIRTEGSSNTRLAEYPELSSRSRSSSTTMFAPNLTMKLERALNVVGGYLAADYYRTGCFSSVWSRAPALQSPPRGRESRQEIV